MKTNLGLKENAGQFAILVLINAFVGGMVGLERTLLPRLAEQEFGLKVGSALLSFIAVFGLTKAVANYFAGALANRIGRKRLLVYGWLAGLPVPVLLLLAPDWKVVLLANALLGVNQGLAWSSTVVMKMDLVGEKNRGLAMGLNEFAGYVAVAAVALLTGWLASAYGLRPYPFLVGLGLAGLGLLGSIFLVNDTHRHVALEARQTGLGRVGSLFWATTLWHPNLSAVTQAGLVNNLNDGMVWGLLPVVLASRGYGLAQTGLLVAVYPAVWGMAQLFTGLLADRFCKKTLIGWGMLAQGLALLGFVWAVSPLHFGLLSVALGLGTAVVYPTFLVAIAENTHPEERAAGVGIFRFWRDFGYVVGALLCGWLAEALGVGAAIAAIALLTVLSAAVAGYRMRCRTPDIGKANTPVLGQSLGEILVPAQPKLTPRPSSEHGWITPSFPESGRRSESPAAPRPRRRTPLPRAWRCRPPRGP